MKNPEKPMNPPEEGQEKGKPNQNPMKKEHEQGQGEGEGYDRNKKQPEQYE